MAGFLGYISQLTGGLRYARRNDLDVAVREAVEDGRAAYILGFYPPANDANAANPFGADLGAGPHRIEIRVNRPGVGLQQSDELSNANGFRASERAGAGSD